MTVTDASGTRAIDYAADGQMLAETLAFSTSLFTLHEKSDILGRNAGYALSNNVGLVTGTMQNFDLYGRLNQVAVDGISGAFTYGYLEGSHLQKTLTMPNGVTRTFGYEPNRDLLTMIVQSNATDRLVQRDFTYDGLGRLIDRTLVRASGNSSATPDAFGYNLRSELTNAVIGANAFAYNFDPIGNRLAATEFGTNTSYVASALNQYTSITPVSPADNAFTPAFDLDGNQTLLKTTTGIWQVWYNAENRPIIFSNDTTVVEMAYDYMGRRFEYKETVNNTLTRHERYLCRKYLQVAALDMLNSADVKHTIAWDPTEPAATRPLALQVGANAYFYSFDQVKNVTELFDSAGTIAETYDYSPFGQITSALSVASNPLTFSSEVQDSTLGLQYYNYRHLNLLDGRWVNRDPIGEEGGNNLYGMIDNETTKWIDFLGLAGEIYQKNTLRYDVIEITAWHCECEKCEYKDKDCAKCDWKELSKTPRRELIYLGISRKKLIIGDCQDLMVYLSQWWGTEFIKAIGCAEFALLKRLLAIQELLEGPIPEEIGKRYWHQDREGGPEKYWEMMEGSDRFYYYTLKTYKPPCTCANKGTSDYTEKRVGTVSEVTDWH